MFLVGTTFFFAGLFKKVILADNIGAYADPVFNDAAEGCDEPLALLKKIVFRKLSCQVGNLPEIVTFVASHPNPAHQGKRHFTIGSQPYKLKVCFFFVGEWTEWISI